MTTDVPGNVPLNAGLGPLPAEQLLRLLHANRDPGQPYTVYGYTREQMLAYAAREVAAERERCVKLCELESVTLATRDMTRAALYCAQKIRA